MENDLSFRSVSFNFQNVPVGIVPGIRTVRSLLPNNNYRKPSLDQPRIITLVSSHVCVQRIHALGEFTGKVPEGVRALFIRVGYPTSRRQSRESEIRPVPSAITSRPLWGRHGGRRTLASGSPSRFPGLHLQIIFRTMLAPSKKASSYRVSVERRLAPR
jgi:hypothetical protein